MIQYDERENGFIRLENTSTAITMPKHSNHTTQRFHRSFRQQQQQQQEQQQRI